MLVDYVSGLMAPWRRIGRVEFVAALAVLSLPGLALMIMGVMGDVGGWLGGARDAFGMAQSGNIDTVLAAARGATEAMTSTPAAPTAPATAEVVMNVPGVVNGLFLLMLYPFIRGRLVDRGWHIRMATLAAIVVQLSVLNDILAALVGLPAGPLPMGGMFGIFTFVAYTVLSVVGSKARESREFGPSRHSQLNDDFPPPRF